MYRLHNPQALVTPDGQQVEDFKAMRPFLGINENPQVSNATLRKDEWELIDDRVNDVFRKRVTVADDLRAAGLVTTMGIGTILRVTERLEAFADAAISFDGDTAPEKDRVSYLRDTIPVPVISKDFDINWRQLAASRNRGDPLDLTAAELAARRVRDKFQDLITNGFTGGPSTAAATIPGLTTAANRLTVTLTEDWDAAGKTGAEIIIDVVAMISLANTNNMFGPFVLYVPKAYWVVIQKDHKLESDRTVKERIEAFSDITSVRPDDSLAADNVVMVQMTRDVIDLSEAQAVTTIQWQKNPMVTHFRVLMVGGPHIKNVETEGGTSVHGIVHLS